MCARRFLMVIFVLTLLVVAGAFAIFQFGGPGTDRARRCRRDISWRQQRGRPGLRVGFELGLAARLSRRPVELASGRRQARRGRQRRGFLHPPDNLPATPTAGTRRLQPGGDTEFRTRLFVQSQASAFNGAGQIWAPRYRQAAFGAFLLNSADAQKALDLAYRRRRSPPSTSSSERPATGRSSSLRTARARSTSSGCFASGSPASRSPSGWSPPTSSAGRSAAPPTCPPSASPLARHRTRAAASCRG